MGRILFYLQYAARNLWRNRRWSTFAIFSVAAGVMTVVALRSLGLAIRDSLTDNVRATLHGDITLSTGRSGFMTFGDPENESTFGERRLQRAQEYVTGRGGTMSAYVSTSGIQLTALDFSNAGRPQFISSLFIDPATYPPTDDIRALDPAGVPLRELFQGGNEVVVSDNLAESQDIQVGDRVRVSGTEEEFVVRGIVPTIAEAGFRDIFAAFFGFAYFDMSLANTLPAPDMPNTISVLLPDGLSTEGIFRAANELDNILTGNNDFVRMQTAPEVLSQNQRIAEVVSSFIVILGLGALLIGGVGIMNTMLVMVRRRTEEIAALKTFGLKGRQIAALFMSEAVILGLLGSLLGGLFGTLLSGAANAYGAALIQQPLRWRFYPEAVMFGLVLGMVVTVIFGVMPVLTAVQVRPAIILRPNELHIPRAGVVQSLFALLLVVVSIGLIAGRILAPSFDVVLGGSNRVAVRVAERVNSVFTDPNWVGILGVAGTLLILGILICLLWVVVWLVGKLPAFGIVDLRLALRNLTNRRIRTATTLLALSAGMFALSSIAFFGAGAREILRFTLSDTLSGNVIILPVLPPQIAQPLVDLKLATLGDLVQYRTRIQQTGGEVLAVDDLSLEEVNRGFNQSEIEQQINEAIAAGDMERATELSARIDLYFIGSWVGVLSRDTDNPNLPQPELLAGRALTPEDRGHKVAMVRYTTRWQIFGAQVGSIVTMRVNNQTFEVEIVGILPENSFENFQDALTFGEVTLPPGVVPVGTDFQLNVIQVPEENLDAVLTSFLSLPLVYAIDISFVDGILARLLNQMSAIPILVGLLSLGAAAVIMANTVALSTLERRRQIGILKAIGLKGSRVLRVMLLENAIVSLLGGLLGLGLSGLGVWLMTKFGLEAAILIPTDALPVAIALVLTAMFIAWLATVLSAQVAIRERVLNVLRYE